MKKILSKFKKYTFWVAFVGVFILFLQNFAKALGYDIDTTNIESAIMSFCGVLVVLGVVTKDSDQASSTKQVSNNQGVVELNIISEVSQTELSKSDIEEIVDDTMAENQTYCCENNIDEPACDNMIIEEDNSAKQTLVECEEFASEQEIINQAQNTAIDKTQTFRDQVCDQVAVQHNNSVEAEEKLDYSEFCDIEKLCPNCPFRQQHNLCSQESAVCDCEQNIDTQPCQTVSSSHALASSEKTQKVVIDPTYSPVVYDVE